MKKRIGLFGLVAGTLVLGWLISPLGAATKTTRYLPAASSGAARVIEVCALGCKYTTLNAACAGETSTAAAPLVIHVFPMIDTTQASCSGEDYLTIQGDGPSSYLNVAGITGENGVLEMGTSTNWTVENMRIKGHRAIISESAGASAGKVTIRNNDLETEAVAADEDCGWFDDPGSGMGSFWRSNHEWIPVFTKGPPRAIAHRAAYNTWRGVKPQADEHPTVKPLGLIQYLLAAAGGECVIDPWMGSGTTLRAARNVGVKSIGIEIEERYCEIAAERMSQGALRMEAACP